MDWVAAVLTLLQYELLRRHHWTGWAVGAFTQGVWLGIAWQTHLWGFVALQVVQIGQCVWALVGGRKGA